MLKRFWPQKKQQYITTILLLVVPILVWIISGHISLVNAASPNKNTSLRIDIAFARLSDDFNVQRLSLDYPGLSFQCRSEDIRISLGDQTCSASVETVNGLRQTKKIAFIFLQDTLRAVRVSYSVKQHQEVLVWMTREFGGRTASNALLGHRDWLEWTVGNGIVATLYRPNDSDEGTFYWLSRNAPSEKLLPSAGLPMNAQRIPEWVSDRGLEVPDQVRKIGRLIYRAIVDTRSGKILLIEPLPAVGVVFREVAGLTKPSLALSINSRQTLALLSRPRFGDGEGSPILALFDTSLPQPKMLCSSYLNILSESGQYYWASIEKMVSRNWDASHQLLSIHASGGDAGDSWNAIFFVVSDNNCKARILHHEYASGHYTGEKMDQCELEKVEAQFLSDSEVEIRRGFITCRTDGTRDEQFQSKKIDLKSLHLSR